MNLITIVIPSYNHAKYLPSLFNKIESIPIDLNVLIIDDCSSDESKEIILDYSNKSKKHVQYYFKQKNAGLVDSLKSSLEKVTTEYIYYISSDDIVNPEGFLDAIKYMNDNKRFNFCIFGGDNVVNGEVVSSIYRPHHDYFFSLPAHKRKREIFYNHPSPILIQSTIFNVAYLKSIKAFSTKLQFDDYPLFIKLLALEENVGDTFGFVTDIKLLNYNHHESNTYHNYLKMYDMFVDVYKQLAPSALKQRSISIIWWQYFLQALLGKQWVTAMELLKKNESILTPVYFFMFAYQKLKNKIYVLR